MSVPYHLSVASPDAPSGPQNHRTVYEDDKHSGTQYALATAVRDQSGEVVAEITLVGSAAEMLPREKRLRKILLQHVDAFTAPPPARAAR
jgi:hypothetical protein